jgi:glycosyltransferase involved in cell wall biosynthesis
VRAAVRLGQDAGVDAVLATGPPFSALVVGARAARRLGVPFVADYRDAWRDYPGAAHPSGLHRARAVALERAVLGGAAAVVCASDFSSEVRELGGPEPLLLPNGFDPADIPTWSPDAAGPLRLAFMGTVYGTTNPSPVLEALASLRDGGGPGSDARLVMVGNVPRTFLDSVRTLGLEGVVEVRGYLPHGEALAVVAGADVGLVVLKGGAQVRAVLTGKIYEYLGMGLPVLLVGPPDGTAADLLRAARAGTIVPYDAAAVSEAIRSLAEAKASGVPPARPDPDVVAAFDRREQAGVLARLLDRVAAR